MGAAVAILLLAASAAPAAAGFRYVPPAEAGASEPAAKGSGPAGAARGTPAPPDADVLHEDIEPFPGPGPAVTGPSVLGTSVWRVHAGEMLREALARWGARAGMDVVFLTDRRYRLEGAAGFGGGFADAVQALFEALSHLPHPPVAGRWEGGTTLVVTHRASRLTDTEDGP